MAVLVIAVPAGATAVRAELRTTEYDALLVSPTNPNHVLLGTEHGLFVTANGGRGWKPAGLEGASVTVLVRAGASIIAGGKGLLARSDNGGKSWVRLHPSGLPDEQIGALAANPRRPSEIYVVLDTFGLFRSIDGMHSFRLVSLMVGPAIKALAVTPNTLLAGGVTDGVFLSSNGKTWRHTAGGMVMALAVNASDPSNVLAASYGIAISHDGGIRWRTIKHSAAMFGAVAWAPGQPLLAYAVGDNHSFWRSTDGGLRWSRVSSDPA
jgi:photosystem II stability/assembly factor-like uncharacterized protein